jgi:hypothetical protein
MTINLAHAFDCDCNDCSAVDVNALGMARFTARKSNTIITTTPALPTVKSEPIRRLPAGQRVGNGRVRKISEKQEWFILKLIKERDLSNLHLVTGQTIDPDEVKYMGVKGASALIEKMLGCPIKGSDSPVMADDTKLPGSDKQIALIEKLAAERNLSNNDLAIMLKAKPTARLLIDALFAMPKPVAARTATPTIEITEGMYTVGDRIFKVQAAKSTGNLYAKELIDGEFEYVQGAITIVRNNGKRMSLEEAKAYGKRTGTCCVCSRELTNPESIASGIGPVCASRF